MSNILVRRPFWRPDQPQPVYKAQLGLGKLWEAPFSVPSYSAEQNNAPRAGERPKLDVRWYEWAPENGWLFPAIQAGLALLAAQRSPVFNSELRNQWPVPGRPQLDVRFYEWSPENGWIFSAIAAQLALVAAQRSPIFNAELRSERSRGPAPLDVRWYRWDANGWNRGDPPLPDGVRIEVELNGVGGGWTDVYDDTTETPFKISRRFQSNHPADLVMAPPTLTWEMANWAQGSRPQGYYSPDDASVRTGWAEGIRVRVRITASGNTRTRFIGWIETIDPTPGVFGEQIVACTAMGWLGQAATTSVVGLGPAIYQRGDQLVSSLVSLSPTAPPNGTSLAMGSDVYPHAFHDLDPIQSTVLDALDSVARSGFDRIWEKGDGTLVFERRQYRQNVLAAAINFSDVTASSQALVDVKATRARRNAMNRWQVTVHPSRVDTSPVVLYAMDTSGNTTGIGAGQTVTITAPYVDPNQQAQQASGFNMLVNDGAGGAVIATAGFLPYADYQFTTGPNGTGADVSLLVSIAVVYGANEVTFTITNTSASTVFYAKLQCRGQGIYDYQPSFGLFTNTTSQAQVNQQTESVDCPYNSDPVFAQSAASYLAQNYGGRALTVDEIQVFVPATDTPTINTLLGSLDISVPVTVSETMLGISAGSYWINGEDLEIDERGNMTFTYALARNVAAAGWQLGITGHDELGINTILQGF